MQLQSGSRVSLAWLFHVAILDTVTAAAGDKIRELTVQVSVTWPPLELVGERVANLSSVQISRTERGWVFSKVKLDHVLSKEGPNECRGKTNHCPPCWLLQFFFIKLVFFLPCLQKSLHFAMWYYLPRTLHLCLRKINTQPICRLYLP